MDFERLRELLVTVRKWIKRRARFLRSAPKRAAVADLSRYLTTNRERMRYATFRAQGYHIGSGALESAVSYVVQQRMKRLGMRWRAAGADAMLALRSAYGSTGLWDQFWAVRRPA